MMPAWLVMLAWASQMWALASPALKALSSTQPPFRAGAQASMRASLPTWPGHVTALGASAVMIHIGIGSNDIE